MRMMNAWKTTLLIGGVVLIAAGFYAARVVSRGFSTADEPSDLERVAARTARNLAIPRKARLETNPFEATPEVLQEARESFVDRCAVCHGPDGSGETRDGRNLYPKAPDLRLPQTQNLTDGEIRYIIRNGVRLTGMPGWARPHDEQGDDSWKLVLFIRSLCQLTSEEHAQQSATAKSAHYAGSQSCQKCHAQIYEHWRRTPMANVVRDPRDHPEAIIPDLSKSDPLVNFTAAEIAFVYGSKWKQRYFKKVGDDYYPFPAQWDITHRQWRPYFAKDDWWAPLYPPDNFKRPTSALCDGCHSVNYDIKTRTVTEWNVGCEKCHGPGSEHVAHPTSSNIVNSARGGYVAASDVCIQCHSQGRL